jgi:hypothetical protein
LKNLDGSKFKVQRFRVVDLGVQDIARSLVRKAGVLIEKRNIIVHRRARSLRPIGPTPRWENAAPRKKILLNLRDLCVLSG